MKKVVAAICIAVTSVMAVALVVIMIMGMRGYQIFNWGFNNVKFGSYDVKVDSFIVGENILVKEDSISMSDVGGFEFIGGDHSVYVSGTNSDKMTVRQYSNKNLGQDELFSLNKSGDYVTIDAKRNMVRIGLFVVWTEDRIEIEVPYSWIGNVDMKTSSGGVKILDKFEWANVDMHCTSGGISVERELKGKDVNISVSSGGVKLTDTITADNIYLKSTSGGIKTEQLVAENKASIECSSGGISLNNTLEADDVYIKCTSGSISTSLIDAGNFTIESSSGGMRIGELTGQGYVKCTSGGIKIDLLTPTGNVELKCTSGGIKAEVPQELKHLVNATATSGSVSITGR